MEISDIDTVLSENEEGSKVLTGEKDTGPVFSDIEDLEEGKIVEELKREEVKVSQISNNQSKVLNWNDRTIVNLTAEVAKALDKEVISTMTWYREKSNTLYSHSFVVLQSADKFFCTEKDIKGIHWFQITAQNIDKYVDEKGNVLQREPIEKYFECEADVKLGTLKKWS